jgi:hypothetical protein
VFGRTPYVPCHAATTEDGDTATTDDGHWGEKEPALFGLKKKKTELLQYCSSAATTFFFSCRSFGGAWYFEFDPSSVL